MFINGNRQVSEFLTLLKSSGLLAFPTLIKTIVQCMEMGT